jgi:hypothetical protein
MLQGKLASAHAANYICAGDHGHRTGAAAKKVHSDDGLAYRFGDDPVFMVARRVSRDTPPKDDSTVLERKENL